MNRITTIVLSLVAPLACSTAVASSGGPASAATPAMAVTAPNAVPQAAPSAAPSSAPAAPPAPSQPAPPEIPKGTAVLHIGDSFTLAGFAQALKPRMKALGVRYEVRAETSSFTTTWSAKMERLVADTQPDLVLINLGANEVANVDPAAHAPAVRRIIAAIGGRPCVWISPPSWRKDTGITDVIRQNSAPCRFFDSDKLVGQPIPRQADGIHPSEQGGAIWADAFWAWLQEQRAPAAPSDKAKRSPWLLRPAPPEEHQPQGR
ncbi:MAG: SGNH/GDSL hydrolase family protein [Minicystis sp.]